MVTHLELDILEFEVKWALVSITTNKASGDDRIPAELFKILKEDAVKVLHSICQQIWKTQPVDRSQFSLQSQRRLVLKDVQTTCTTVFISHASKVMFKILQSRLQQYVN